MNKQTTETFKKKRETMEVSKAVKDNLKSFIAIKKKILEAFADQELTIPQIAEATGMTKEATTYYTMTLLKFGMLQVVSIDDDDEFYIYKKTTK